MEKKNKLSRKQFLQICGSVVAGGSILGVSGALLRKNASFSGDSATNFSADQAGAKRSASPYKQVTSFETPAAIEAFELSDDGAARSAKQGERLIVAAAGSVYVYDRLGNILNNFAVGNDVRDMALDGGELYLLFASRIAVYDLDGSLAREWQACSEQDDYCSMAVAGGFVFATDAANKHICQYTVDGAPVRFIKSPDGFIIPSYTFGIACVDDVLYCSNSGRHRIEKYTLDGQYLGAFGKAGGATGMFCGCCNPVHVAATSAGEIITSEKGNPRISCYGADGQFRSLLMDAATLGGGVKAYEARARGGNLYVAGGNRVSVFRYDAQAAAQTACAACAATCPMKG